MPFGIGPDFGERNDATSIVNRYESLFKQNAQAGQSGQLPADAAQQNFERMWTEMQRELQPLGEEGQRALQDRSPGGQFDWWSTYSPEGSWASGQGGAGWGGAGGGTPGGDANVPEAFSPYYQGGQGYQVPSYGQGIPGFSFTTDEPLQMAEQNRMYGYTWGRGMDADLQNALGTYGDREQGFLDWQVAGPGGYGDILQGKGGFSPEQQQNILQKDYITGGMASPQEWQALGYLSKGEQEARLGSPYLAAETFASQIPRYENAVYDAAGNQRSIFGPEGSMGGLMPYGKSEYDAAINPELLGLSGEFLQNYKFGPEDEQAMVDAAGRTVGLRTQSEMDQLERNAAAQGQSSPLAIQSALSRSQLTGDIGAADAMTQARIGAKQLGLDTSLQREGMRLGTEQDISNREMQRISSLLGLGLNIGQSELGMEQGLSQDMYNMLKYDIGNRTGLTQYGEAESAGRHGTMQDAQRNYLSNMTNQRYAQGANTAQYLGNQYGNIYNTQLGQEQQARNWLADQQKLAQEGAATTRQQRIGAASTSFAPITQSTGQAMTWSMQPSIWDKLLSGAQQGAKTYLGMP